MIDLDKITAKEVMDKIDDLGFGYDELYSLLDKEQLSCKNICEENIILSINEDYTCTRPKYHKGIHVALGISGMICYAWEK